MRGTAVPLLLLALPGWAGELEAPVRLEAGGKPLDVTGGHAAPCVVDFNRDGKRDLLVGQFLGEGSSPFGAQVRFYRNVGAKDEPRFEGYKYLRADGTAISVPSG